MPRLVKGAIQPFDPRTRRRDRRIEFQFNPSTVMIRHEVDYQFRQAPVSRRAFAQFSTFKPIEVSFTLNFFYDDLSMVNFNEDNPDYITDMITLVDQRYGPSAPGIPPLVELQMGQTFSHLGRLPKGVITQFETNITQQRADLTPEYYSANITFFESYIAGHGA